MITFNTLKRQAALMCFSGPDAYDVVKRDSERTGQPRTYSLHVNGGRTLATDHMTGKELSEYMHQIERQSWNNS